MRRARRYSDRAFTLIEVVIAISILVVIMGVTYGALTQIIRSKKMLDDGRDAGLIANAILSRITRELQLAYSGIPLMPPRDQLKLRNPPSKNLTGEDRTLGNGLPGDTVTFIALEGGQYLPDGGTHSGLVQLTYRVEEDPEQKGQEEETYYLIRDEVPYSTPFDKAYKKSMIFPVTRNLVSLQLRYYDQNNSEWVTSWGEGSRIKLPKLVEFTVKLKTPAGVVEEFSTVVSLRSIN